MKQIAEPARANGIAAVALALLACAAPRSWAEDGPRIAFGGVTRDFANSIYVITPEGDGLEELTDHGDWASYPEWSRDGSRIAFDYSDGALPTRIYRMNADGSNQKPMSYGPWDTGATWSPQEDAIAFGSARDGSHRQGVYTADFHRGGGGLRISGGTYAKFPSWSPAGDVIAYASDRAGSVDIHTMDRLGRHLAQLTDGPDYYTEPSWHPRGEAIAFESWDEGNRSDVYTMAPDGADQRRLTVHPASDTDPTWSPIGTQILFTSDRDGDHGLFIMELDGRIVRKVTDDRFMYIEGSSWFDPDFPRSVSPIGRHAATWGWLKRLRASAP